MSELSFIEQIKKNTRDAIEKRQNAHFEKDLINIVKAS